MSALDGQVAVITGVGASSGLGNSLAKTFAGEGAKVVGIDYRSDNRDSIERSIKEIGGEFTFIEGDLRNVVDCERLVRETVDTFGRIDVLISNAMTNPDPFGASHDVTEEAWDACLDTMLKGTFFCCKFALREMLKVRRGTILNIGSQAAIGAFPRNRAYGAAKAGVLHLSAGMAEEYRADGIRVHGIIMGAVNSDEFRQQWARSPRARAMVESERDAFMAAFAKRTGHPDDIAAELCRIVIDGARWVSGDAIQVPGSIGMLAPVATVMVRPTPG